MTTLIKLAIVGVSGNTHSDKIKLESKHLTWAADQVKDYIKNIRHHRR